MKSRIRVNPTRLTAGEPPIVVYDETGRRYVTAVHIDGPADVRWVDGDPPSVWVETDSPLITD